MVIHTSLSIHMLYFFHNNVDGVSLFSTQDNSLVSNPHGGSLGIICSKTLFVFLQHNELQNKSLCGMTLERFHHHDPYARTKP